MELRSATMVDTYVAMYKFPEDFVYTYVIYNYTTCTCLNLL